MGSKTNTPKDYAELGVILVILLAVGLALKQFNLLPTIGITGSMSYGLAFGIGLVAATSTCIAVTGGLLVALAAKYNEAHPELQGFEKFKSHLIFNAGRIIGYTVLGSMLGFFGSLITLSTRTNGILTLIISAIMILLGLQLLRLIPKSVSRFIPTLPKSIGQKLNEMSASENPAMPFALGAGTFFVPCGFTQALQLYVLGIGDPWTGGIVMLMFALGTLPALLSLSALSSFLNGNAQRVFLRFAGVLVILLGLMNIDNGLALAGFGNSKAGFSVLPSGSNIRIENGVQIAEMKVEGLEYFPYQFTVMEGIPVEWRIDGSGALGCAQMVTSPGLKIAEFLPTVGEKSIRFTPDKPGTYAFQCGMGMTTPGAAFIVLPKSS